MKNVMIYVLALCMAVTTTACSLGILKPPPSERAVPASAPASAISETPPPQGKVAREMIKDLIFYVPEPLEAIYLLGAEQHVFVPVNPDMPGFDSGSDLTIMPQMLGAERGQNGEPDVPTERDASGRPILTLESVKAMYNNFEDGRLTFELLDSGAMEVGGEPASYIEVKIRDTTHPDETWQTWIIQVVYDDFRYDLSYLSTADVYQQFKPAAAGIIASIIFDSAKGQTEETVFGGLTLHYPNRDVSISDIDQGFAINLTRDMGNIVRFYIRQASDRSYTEDMLDDADAVDRMFRLHAEYVTILEPREISREATDLNGKRAVRSVYHDDFRQYDNYLVMYILVHNGDLYTISGQGEIGQEDKVHDFIDPILASITFSEESDANANRPEPVSVPETIRWINYTYAVITIRNGGNIDVLGGFEPTPRNVSLVKDMLLMSWNITDKESSDAVLQKLHETGHRSDFLAFAKSDPIYQMEYAEYQAAIEALPEDKRVIYENSYDIYRQFCDKSLLAWDYCRMIHLLCSGYLAGYYTREEALDRSLEIALELQGTYASWDDMYRNYLAGFHFWQPGDVGDAESENYRRFMIWMSFVLSKEGPYSMLWDTKLSKEW